MNLTRRPRRLRRTAQIRNLVHEVDVRCDDLIYPVFVTEGENVQSPIESMPGIYHYSLDRLAIHLKEVWEKGVRAVIFFGVPDHKDACGSGAYDPDGIVQRALRMTKKLYPEMICIADICLCEYTNHGHCGVIKDGEVLNDETLELLSKAAVSCAAAGADIVAPSDMMDGRVDAIRTALDENGFYNVMIMSYSAKYASAFYEPFRAAADSSPTCGNRKSYQMDPANALEAIRECELDVIEGADFLMVKPALPYLDIIKTVREEFTLPLVSYNVSGEYSMIMAAIEKGFLTENAILESLISIKRAGSDLIITNFASYVLLNDLL